MAQNIQSNHEESINPIALLYSNHSVDQIAAALLDLCRNRKLYDKHALSYFLNMADPKGMHLMLCDIRKRDEIFSMLETRINSNPMMIFKLVKSDYTANKLLEILQKEKALPKAFHEDYIELKQHLAEGVGYICEDILQDAWEYFSEIPFEEIREELKSCLKLDRMFKSEEEEGGASC
jgi:hypothetical protein